MKDFSSNSSDKNKIPEGHFCSYMACNNCYYAGDIRNGEVYCTNSNWGGYNYPHDRENCSYWESDS